MSETHPNDQIVFRQYPDTVQRETYPPLPRKMGNPNAVASEAVIGTVLARLPTSVSVVPTTPPIEVPDTPETAAYKAAGWL